MRIKLPQGVQDFVSDECYNKTLIEDKLGGLFRSYGYEKIEPTAIEYFDTFCGSRGSVPQAKMFKMTDVDGNLLVLRPDPTMQVSRIVAERFADEPLKRLYYATSSYEFDAVGQSSRTREFAQTGVELIGSADIGADIEAIVLAIKSCLACGIRDFQIELGHIDYFYGWATDLGLNAAQQEKLRGYVGIKDMLGAELFLRECRVPIDRVKDFLRLTYLFGGTAVLEKAKKLAANDVSVRAVDHLECIYRALSNLDLDRYLTIDLSMVKRNNYYSGIVFRGITRSLGQPLLDGGRYDRLSENYGVSKCAVGFGIGLKRFLVALERQNALMEQPRVNAYCVVLDEESEAVAHRETEAMRAKALVVARYFGSKEDCACHCARLGVKKMLVYSKASVTEEEVRNV